MEGVRVCVLAGGLGTRLQPSVADRPKPLAVIGDRPFLSYLFDQLAGAGCRQAVLAVGYRGEQIRQHFGDRYGPLRLAYSMEEQPLGTGGAVRLARRQLESDPVLIMNGDSFLDADLPAFLAFYREKRARLAMALARQEETSRFGRVELGPDGRVSGFVEKSGPGGAGLINGGIYLVSAEFLDSLPEGTVSLERQVFPAWMGKDFFGWIGEGAFIDIGTPESYAGAAGFFAARGGTTRSGARLAEGKGSPDGRSSG